MPRKTSTASAETSDETARAFEDRFRHIFESCKDGILILDADTRKIIEANPVMTELLGYAREEFIGKELWEFGLLRDEAASKTAFQELQEKNFIRYDDLPLQTKDGRTIQVEFVSNLYCEGGNSIIQCNIRDITERKRTEQQLAEKARLLDLSNDAIIVRGLNDKVSLWNKGAEKLYGWTAGEVIGKHLHSLLKTEFPKSYEEIVAQLYHEGKFVGEVVQIARNGRRIHSLCRWVLDPETKSILTSYTDNTDRKEAEEALKKTVTERTQMVQSLESLSYTLAHDLRAPIRAIKGLSEVWSQEAPSGNTGREYAQRIQQAAERMSLLLDDLLEFSRMSYQSVPLGAVNLEIEVEKILTELSQEIQAINADIQVQAPLPVVSGNATLIEQVLSNLISNALKFVQPGVMPKILIRAETRGSSVRLWVEDNGIGIAPEHQDKLFGVFQRLHSTNEFDGTGVGLAIVKRAVERMGGSVGVESEPGKGSKFWIELVKATDLAY
ncbi:MAG: PAS domain S-box protein [Verrucomicrobia bacterium]|nr:PAS domain S-box protein [Verrucomicrobiota bacterium]